MYVYLKTLTNVTLGITPVTTTPRATTQWVPMIVSVTRDLLEMVLIVQVRSFVVRHTAAFLSILLSLIILGLVHADINECHTGSHTCHANASCNNTVGSYDCFCNKGFSGEGVNCSGKNLCCKTHKIFSIFVTYTSFGSCTFRCERV